MTLQLTWRAHIGAVALAWCAALMAGCASWQGPRIDPTGERLLLWPNEPAAPMIIGPPAGAPVIQGPPFGAPVIQAPPFAAIAPPTGIGAPLGNVQAAPVYSDTTIVPAVPAPAAVPLNPFAPAVAAPPIIAAPAPPAAVLPVPISPTVQPVGTPVFATPLGGLAPPAGVEYLRMTPSGVMAPVGTEVVVKASICGCDGNLVPNRRVEWGLAGAGQFSELGAPHQVGYFNWPWEMPRKIANDYAVGSTANIATTLYRGTPDPADDVPVYRGESWVTVTSACEGTSLVTACTPALASYNRVTTTVYWIDAQFLFPPSAVVEAGRTHVLTTTVIRRTDSAPLAGWLVRYDVAGGASLGYEGGNFVEVPTDAAGRASVEVSPVSAGGGTTNVFVTIIRPPVVAPVASPRLELGRGSATITWGAGAAVVAPVPGVSGPPPGVAPFTPAPVIPPPPLSPQSTAPAPSLPSGPTPAADPYRPPADEPAAGRPQLELQLRRTGPEQLGVGEFTSFDVTITNRGTGTARGILVQDRFDPGLRHPEAKPNEFAVKYSGVRDLPPGESATVPLTFQVVAGGMQCHEVTITAENAEPAMQRACITATQAAVQVSMTGPRSRVVGEAAPFNVVVKNVGDVAALNVEVVVHFDPVLVPTEIGDESHQRLADGGIVLSIDRLEPREQRPFPMTARCQSPSDRACGRAVVTADGGITSSAEACLSILPPSPAAP